MQEMAEKPEPLGKVFKEQHHGFSPTIWTTSYLEQNTSNKALINFNVANKKNRKSKSNSRWDLLPDLLLERIFSFLTIRDKYYASLVCRRWYHAFYLPYVWSQFVLSDNTLTRAKFNYYQGWQYVLDHVRTQSCLTQVGRNFKNLTFEPMLNFFNLYEFMNMVSWFCEQEGGVLSNERGIAKRIESLKFTFPCNMDNRDEDERAKKFGTGGKLLGALKRLVLNLPKLKRLELIDLMLEVHEAAHLLDDVCDVFCLKLKTLILINTTKSHYQLLHVGVFLNLHVLVISPQNLGDDVVELLGYSNLRHLHVYQNRYTPEYVVNLVTNAAWKSCRKNNPHLMVHVEIESLKDRAVIWPGSQAPVRSILYDSPAIGIQLHIILNIIEMYKSTLTTFGHKNLPRGYRSRAFNDRVDEPLMLLCRQCSQLQTLIINERISTSTVLLIATTSKNLENLYVRRNAVIKKCDWARNPDWSEEFYQWLKVTSKSYESVECEVSQILGCPWKMLSDKSFKELQYDLYRDELNKQFYR